MATVDPAKHTCFRDIFHAVAEIIDKGLSTSIAVAANEHWGKWTVFYGDVSLDPQFISYRDSPPKLNASSRQ